MRTLGLGMAALWLTGCGQTAEVKAPEAKLPEMKLTVAEPVPPVAAPLVIPAGTRLSIRTTNAISSETAVPGQGFTASVAEPVLIDGRTVVPRGAAAGGVILSTDDGGRVKGVASLSLGLTSLRIGGKQVKVASSVFTKNGPATKKKDAVKIGIGAGIGAAIGAIAGGGKGAAVGAASGAGAGTAVVLATRGDPAVVEEESLLNFRLTKSLTVQQ